MANTLAEVLAPVGSWDCLLAAVRCGADAVYLGGGNFNARRGADNFTPDSLTKAVQYAHTHGVKVYYTLNTLVSDRELPLIEEELERICTSGVDALILQDLGVIDLVKRCCPALPLHGSTQLSIHTPEGAKLLEDLGFSRVVLSREMSAKEVLEVRKATNLEIEYFVHGALCMSVSGQCLMSAFFGSRSGNRGLCAQPCRLPASVSGGTGHDLSLKDNCLLRHTEKLINSGVYSFKIEGRMKRPEYVASAVTAYRHAVDGAYSSEEEEDLKNVFSRSGFTDGYFVGETGRHMFGTREKEDVLSASGALLKKQAQLYAKETPTVPLSAHLKLKEGELPALTVTALGEEVTVTGTEVPEPARSVALTEEYLEKLVGKTGGTQYYLSEFSTDLGEGLSTPAKNINALRRLALEELENKIIASTSVEFNKANFPTLKKVPVTDTLVYTRLPSGKLLTNTVAKESHTVILPLETSEEEVKEALTKVKNLALEVPRCYFGKESKVKELLLRAKELGVNAVTAGNLATTKVARELGFTVIGGLGLNLFNSYAFQSAKNLGVSEALASVECSSWQLECLSSPIPVGAVVYGHLPLMITRNCPLKNGRTCDKCDKLGYITDRKGEQLPVRCRFGCSEVLNPHPLYMLDKLSEVKVNFHLLYFTVENENQVDSVISAYKRSQAPSSNFTRGLYKKGVK